MKSVFTLLALAATALANVDYPYYDSHFTFTPGDQWCGNDILENAGPAQITFKFPQPSTIMQYWGYQQNTEGAATICIDGGSCQTINYFNDSIIGTEPPRLLLSLTGLSNTTHTLTITNSNATEYNVYGLLSVDHVTLAGSAAPASALAPSFPAGSFIASTPLYLPFSAGIQLGGHPPVMIVLLDSGAPSAWANWVGCTDPDCNPSAHRKYTPSTNNFYNYSIVDTIYYGSGDEYQQYRVNDTFNFGNLTYVTTFGADFNMPYDVTVDGNFGVSKALFSGGYCTSFVKYPNFVETAYVNGLIKTPILAFYQIMSTDAPAAGLSSVAQIGGLDRNKYTGTMDWIPVDQEAQWISPIQTRTVQVSSTSPLLTLPFTYQKLLFDTGDPGALGIPTSDWNILVNGLGAKRDKAGTWWFPCGSTVNLNFKGSAGRNYPILISDQTQENVCGLCPTLANDGGNIPNWIMGAPFLGQYYFAFHYLANVVGLGAKNLGASAATSSVIIGQA